MNVVQQTVNIRPQCVLHNRAIRSYYCQTYLKAYITVMTTMMTTMMMLWWCHVEVKFPQVSCAGMNTNQLLWTGWTSRGESWTPTNLFQTLRVTISAAVSVHFSSSVTFVWRTQTSFSSASLNDSKRRIIKTCHVSIYTNRILSHSILSSYL